MSRTWIPFRGLNRRLLGVCSSVKLRDRAAPPPPLPPGDCLRIRAHLNTHVCLSGKPQGVPQFLGEHSEGFGLLETGYQRYGFAVNRKLGILAQELKGIMWRWDRDGLEFGSLRYGQAFCCKLPCSDPTGVIRAVVPPRSVTTDFVPLRQPTPEPKDHRPRCSSSIPATARKYSTTSFMLGPPDRPAAVARVPARPVLMSYAYRGRGKSVGKSYRRMETPFRLSHCWP